jgi:hypothetical protein
MRTTRANPVRPDSLNHAKGMRWRMWNEENAATKPLNFKLSP